MGGWRKEESFSDYTVLYAWREQYKNVYLSTQITCIFTEF